MKKTAYINKDDWDLDILQIYPYGELFQSTGKCYVIIDDTIVACYDRKEKKGWVLRQEPILARLSLTDDSGDIIATSKTIDITTQDLNIWREHIIRAKDMECSVSLYFAS